MLTVLNYLSFIFNFNSHYNIISFQSPATPIMEGIIDLHNYIFFYLILVFVFVSWMFCYILYNFYILPTFFFDNFLKKQISKVSFSFLVYYIFYFLYKLFNIRKLTGISFENYLVVSQYEIYNLMVKKHNDYLFTRKITENAIIELVWTIIPSFILILIAVPSFALLYAMDEIIDPRLTVKALGYQWFWNYEYAETKDELLFNEKTDFLGYNIYEYRNYLNYDSVMYNEEDLPFGYHRLLDVDHQMILPINIHIRLMVTAGDVIHSFAVPSLGIKIDAVPGRMNQVGIYIKRSGIFYGQCSELCGVNHGFMPIVVKAVSYSNFLKWYYNRDIFWN